MQHSHPTPAFKPLISIPRTLYLLPLHPHHRLMLLAVSLCLLFLFPLLNSLRFFKPGMLGVSKPGALNFYTLLCLLPLTLFASRNLTLIYRPLSGFSALRSDGIHSRSGIFSTNVTDARGGVIIFVRQGLSFSELSTFSLSSLDPYSDYAEVNISLNDSFSLSFLNVYAPPIPSSPKDSRTNFFSSFILPSYVEAEAVEFSRFRFHIPGSNHCPPYNLTHRQHPFDPNLLQRPNSSTFNYLNK